MNTRTSIFRYPVDAAGGPDPIQLPPLSGSFHKVVASIEGGVHGGINAWIVHAPIASSPGKRLSANEFVFDAGVYREDDLLGYVELDSNSGYLILFCER